MLRKLELEDYYKNFLNLLSQLTTITDISFYKFEQQFINLGSNYKNFVIERDNKIIAYGSLFIDYKFYRNYQNIGHIEDIIVDEDYRGNGYSTQIINKLIEESKKYNCYKIVLNCKDNYTNFYNKFGFKKDSCFMIKHL